MSSLTGFGRMVKFFSTDMPSLTGLLLYQGFFYQLSSLTGLYCTIDFFYHLSSLATMLVVPKLSLGGSTFFAKHINVIFSNH